jgi:formamidopyrimidine-DNA glycosylase
LPELPDVEVFRRYVNATSLHKEIQDVEIRTDLILEETTSRKLKNGLKNRSFNSTRRHGKYLFLALNNPDWLVLHFGMTGRLRYYEDPSIEPEYTQFLIEFNNDYRLALVMPRKLGAIRLISDVEDFIQEKELGPDLYDPNFDYKTFLSIMQGRRGMIKPTLMNQKIMAGIGNIYSDEILFQARLHPEKPVDHLHKEDMERIFKKIRHVLKTAVDDKANPDRFPSSWIIPHREKGAKCPNCGGEIENIIVSGRSAYYCPNCQSA